MLIFFAYGFSYSNDPINVQNQNKYNCASDSYNCKDFSSYSKALEVFQYCGGTSNDVHKLDRDKDGIPCEGLRK